jgi:SAM-dependent methyltransferase
MSGEFELWYTALQRRYTASLTFQEVRRAVQALSAIYVEERERISRGAAFSRAGKRAAFATFFAPLHFLLVQHIVRALGANHPPPATILDFGCGLGSAGAAWALDCDPRPRLIAIDRSSWAVQETRWTYETLGLIGGARTGDARDLKIPAGTALIAAFTVNELQAETRTRLLRVLLRSAGHGSPVLVIEPIARRLTDWWDEWGRAFAACGGREERWRFRIELPEQLALMDRAAALDHRELTGRSLWLPGSHATVGFHDLLPKMRTSE